MPFTREELQSTLLALPRADRAALAQELLLSLEPADNHDVEAAWIAEAERRYAALVLAPRRLRRTSSLHRDPNIIY